MAIMFIVSCSMMESKKNDPLIGKKIVKRYPLTAEKGHLAYDHFLINFNRTIDYIKNTITISGTIEGNPYRNTLNENKSIKLKELLLYVILLDSSTRVVEYKNLSFSFERGDEPNIFAPLPFQTEIEFSEDFVFIAFGYKVQYLNVQIKSRAIKM